MKDIKNYTFLILFVILLVIAFLLIKEFIASIFLGMLLAYLFFPFYRALERPIKNKSIRAGIVTITIIAILLIITFLIGKLLAAQAVEFFNFARSKDITEAIYSYVQSPLNEQFKQIYDKALITIIRFISNLLLALPQQLLGIFIAIFTFYYFLKDGELILNNVKSTLQLNPLHEKQIEKKFRDVTKALIYGNLIVAVVQGFLGGLGFYIFNISSPLLWGVIMIITSFIPAIGTGLIWFPAAIWKLLQGDLFNGFGLLIYGFFIISTIDNLLRPHLVSSKTKIHPIIILLGVIGGIRLFGFIGLIAGPLLLDLFFEMIKLYRGGLYEIKG